MFKKENFSFSGGKDKGKQPELARFDEVFWDEPQCYY